MSAINVTRAVDANAGVGFFGKVRSHGDFVTRRLPASFTRSWDDWLQTGLQASREALGPDWLAIYLNSPIWRFALAPGVCGAHAWAGVLMPSVDRVGRQFPLTIAAAAVGVGGVGGVVGVADIAEAAPLLDGMTQAGDWYDRLETLALSSLGDDFSLDEFDAALKLLPAPPPPPPSLAAASTAGLSRWWTDGSQLVPPCVRDHRSLPAGAAFTALLDGRWQEHGWSQPD